MPSPGNPSGGAERHHADFRLSITKALGDQLADSLSKLRPAPLSEANLAQLQKRPGVYQLFRRGEPEHELVYVGKAEKSLPSRLGQHLRKLSGRENVSVGEMLFSCLYVDEDFSALAPEQLLIGHYRRDGRIPWNTMGFGNRDPGRNRDDSIVERNHFDVLFPVDLEHPVAGIEADTMTLRALCQQVKRGLPFNFRYDARLGAAADSKVTIANPDMTASDAFSLISRSLPAPWQVTVLPGYVIMYPDNNRTYHSARRYYRGAEVADVVPVFAAPGEIKEEASYENGETE